MEDYSGITDRPDIGLGDGGYAAEVFAGTKVDFTLDSPGAARYN